MTSQKLNEEHEILRRFMAVVVSSAFRDSLIDLCPNREKSHVAADFNWLELAPQHDRGATAAFTKHRSTRWEICLVRETLRIPGEVYTTFSQNL